MSEIRNENRSPTVRHPARRPHRAAAVRRAAATVPRPIRIHRHRAAAAAVRRAVRHTRSEEGDRVREREESVKIFLF